MERYDIIVIGGGPAGLMAACAAGRQGARVLLLEKGERLGRKLIISGGGRCNVTNRKSSEELVRQIVGNGRFMYSALSSFGSEEIIRFFEGLGIKLKEEDHGRIFPMTDKALSVANALIEHIRQLGVTVRLHAPVDHLLIADGRCTGVAMQGGEKIRAAAVIVAVGGKSVPATGSTGDGYAWARQAGHTITELYPTEVPLKASDPFIRSKALQGLSLRDVGLTLHSPQGKKLTAQRGDLIFTHFGLSGPGALRCSHFVSVTHLKHGRVPLPLTLDLFPDLGLDQVQREMTALVEREPKKAVKNALRPWLAERLIPVLLEMAGIDEATTFAHLPKDRWQQLARLVKAFPVTVTGTLGIAEAFVTGGGVAIAEIDPATMASRMAVGLYFAGEVIDVHAHTGGYNITVAFSSGWAAGSSAARCIAEPSTT
ncbi:MAG TPA: NAD(P)/FAD-dependent oxidoreductase [Symbiobacteriaceae bacterium]|nr:NAD(P)/FAD-dependent oxidoreductase [Symbiobacteriaceae bacterium]